MMSTNTEFNLADHYTRNLGLHNLGEKNIYIQLPPQLVYFLSRELIHFAYSYSLMRVCDGTPPGTCARSPWSPLMESF